MEKTRKILVTGARSGIGLAVVNELLNQGQQVVGCCRDITKLNLQHPCFYPVPIDLSSTQAVSAFAREILKSHPDLSAVVFCAGYGQFGGLEQFSFDQIERLLTVNLTSQMLLTRALLPALKKQSVSHLIYMGSEAALQGKRNGAVYCASKFALRGFSQALRDECGRSSVRVTLINPGMVKTPFFDDLSFQPGEGFGQSIAAKDVAETVSWVLNASPAIVVDEINLTPATQVVQFKK